MTNEQAVALYFQLTGDIRTLWFAFGGLAVLFVGWLLTRKDRLRAAQRLALTIGWFASAGYLASALTNRYTLLTALVGDIAKYQQTSELMKAISSLSSTYPTHTVFVFGAVGAISFAAMLLVWSNIALAQGSGSKQSDA